MPEVLLAPDKFKGTLSGAEVAASLADGIHSRRPGTDVVAIPVADGGDGFLDAFEAAGFAAVTAHATDAAGQTVATRYMRRGETAAVELAQVAGLAGLGSALRPLTASSHGLGEVIAHALDAGATRIVVGIGGSASTDGGVGMVQALGAHVFDADGNEVAPGVDVARAATLDLSGLHPGLASADLVFACDVDNPLTGPTGAAAVYGPQKGATPEQVRELDAALTHWAELAGQSEVAETPGAGAAGGIGFGACAVLGARLAPGAPLVLDMTGFDDALAGADLVVTGEGSLDEQTMNGKAPAEVARRAHDAGVRVVAVAGQCLLDPARVQAAGIDHVYALTDIATDREQAMRDGAKLLYEIGVEIATSYLEAR